MPQQRVIMDYTNEGVPFPAIYVLTFEPCEINWDKPVFYYNAIKPFKIDVDDLDIEVINMSIHFSDFIFNEMFPSRIGLNLNALKKRIAKHPLDPESIRQFILSYEIDELLSRLPQERKMSLLLEERV